MNYKEEVCKAMKWLSEKQDTIFIGQTVKYDGSVISSTLKDIPQEKRIEFPVAEELQCGVSLGMALSQNCTPITIFPRIDFLLLAINQLSNHLDVLNELTHGEWQAHVIIRTIIGSKYPMYPGIQHCRDHTDMFRELLTNIPVIKLLSPHQIMYEYQKAYDRKGSTLLIEMAELYG